MKTLPVFRAIAVGVLMFIAFPSVGQERNRGSTSVTDAELAMLPAYCRAKLRGSPEEKSAWNRRMGREQFVHVHHHCFGLNLMTRVSMESDPGARKFLLQRAVANFNYVLSRWPENFPLTAEARQHKMQAEGQLAQYGR